MLDIKYTAEIANKLYEKKSDEICRAICKFLLGIDPCAQKATVAQGKEQAAVSTTGKQIIERN